MKALSHVVLWLLHFAEDAETHTAVSSPAGGRNPVRLREMQQREPSGSSRRNSSNCSIVFTERQITIKVVIAESITGMSQLKYVNTLYQIA